MRYRFPIVVLGLWLLAAIYPGNTGTIPISGWAIDKSAATTLESKQLKEAINLSAAYLIKQCRKNGKFLYRINVNPAIRPKPKYNLLRHAGAIYALAFYEFIKIDSKLYRSSTPWNDPKSLGIPDRQTVVNSLTLRKI